MEQHGNREPAPRTRQRQSTRKKLSTVWFVIRTLLLIFILTSLFIGGIFAVYVKTTLAPTLDVNADDYTMNLSSIMYYQDKDSGDWKELQTLYGNENRIWVDYDQIPKALWQAAVSIEDQRFFDHHGVDWSRTISATANLFLGFKNSYGGSTITQQLLKNMTKDDAGTVNRKVREIFRALEFEKKYSKQEILTMYLNTIYLGKRCYGVETAAQYYFGKDASQLSVAECASLIAITNNPALYGPMSTVVVTNPDTGAKKTARDMNKSRQETILGKMLELGYIDEATYKEAMAEKLNFTDGSVSADELVAAAEGQKDGTQTKKYNSYFVDEVFRDVSKDLAEKLGISETDAQTKLYNGGYSIYTTIDPNIQGIAESVYENRANLNVTSSSGQLLQSGITIIDPSTGNVVAMVGGVGEKTGNLVWNYATGKRQVGSSIKPLTVYSPALDAGVITMASTFDNYPVRLLNGVPWPKNSPQGYTGLTTIEVGVAKSINTVAIRTLEALGTKNSYNFATQKLNLPLVEADLNESSLGLGGLTNGLSTQDMAAAYATFDNGGVYNSPRLYTEVRDSDGNVVLENKAETHVAMKDTTAYFMTELLKGTMNFGTGAAYKLKGMSCAGKTGTTSDNYDRYFVGYTPYYCAAVWCGYDKNERISYSGNPSAHMWEEVMQKIADEEKNKNFDKPSANYVTVNVCMDSGMLATDTCAADLRGSRVETVEVLAGTAPTQFCTMHVLRDYCTEGKTLAGPYCPADSVKQVGLLDYTRTDYGPDIVADDNDYLLSTVEARGSCPVHTAETAAPAQSSGGDSTGTVDPGDIPPGEEGNYPGDTTTPSTGDGDTTTPSTGNGDTTTPSTGNTNQDTTGNDWWNQLWDPTA